VKNAKTDHKINFPESDVDC